MQDVAWRRRYDAGFLCLSPVSIVFCVCNCVCLCLCLCVCANCSLLCVHAGPFVFNVSSVNQYAEVVAARDQYSYPDAPVVHAVRGCSGFDGNKTTNCPTQGQITITVLGEKFAATNSTTSVKIGVDVSTFAVFLP